MELSAQEDAAHMLDGTAAQMVCTVLPLLLIAHLLPRRQLLKRWLPTSSVMELSAQEDAAHMLDGTAAQMVSTVLPLLLIVPSDPGGCCPYVGWYCCPDGQYCAATAAD